MPPKKFYDSAEFKQLNKEWKDKLEKSGFKDVEREDGCLKTHASNFRSKEFLKNYQSKAEYYYMAAQFLNEYKFESVIEKTIWEKHSEGIGVRVIAKEFKAKGTKISYPSVWLIVDRLKKTMYAMYKAMNESPKHE